MIGIPRTPLLLGLAGLIPFVWGMVTSIYQVTWASDLFVGHGVLADYGMVILSFMSGVIWGFATRTTGRQANLLYVLSVIPALWAFLFAFGEYMLLTLAAGFLFILPIDIVATRGTARLFEAQGIAAKAVTPFLLARIHDLTKGRSLEANIALVLNNARLGVGGQGDREGHRQRGQRREEAGGAAAAPAMGRLRRSRALSHYRVDLHGPLVFAVARKSRPEGHPPRLTRG